jgi:hypothetical protein
MLALYAVRCHGGEGVGEVYFVPDTGELHVHVCGCVRVCVRVCVCVCMYGMRCYGVTGICWSMLCV